MNEYRTAIELNPLYAEAHGSLGNAFLARNQLDDAIAAFRTAIKLGSRNAAIHNNLGNACLAKNQADDAIAAYTRASELDPRNAAIPYNLANAFLAKNRLDDAIAACNKAIALNPGFAEAHTSLGRALAEKNQLDEGIAEFRKAIELNPKLAEAHANLGRTLTERLVREVSRLKGRHAAVARLYADAFTADPKLADDLHASHRYNAACIAALAAAGQGTDADQLDTQQHRRLRQQVLVWLRRSGRVEQVGGQSAGGATGSAAHAPALAARCRPCRCA